MISIITPTIRKDGLEIVRQSIKNQTYRDFEWLIGSPFDPEIPEAIWVKDDFKGGFWSLNRIYNRLFVKAQGDLVISWQDNIWIPADGIEKFVISSNNYPHSLIGGVGDQYERLDKFGKPEVKIWSDPRKTIKHGTFYEINPCDVEWNFCACPRQALFDIGGFDSGLDFIGFGMDGYQVNERLDLLGYKFYIDQTNETYTLRHNRDSYGGEDKWNKNNNLTNGNYEKRRLELIRKKQWPILDFLK